MRLSFVLLSCLVAVGHAFNVAEPSRKASRRDILQGLVGLVGAEMLSSALPVPALASGGATAGKYT
jgi:hypothetical protein